MEINTIIGGFISFKELSIIQRLKFRYFIMYYSCNRTEFSKKGDGQ